MSELYRVVAPHFVAGVVLEFRCTQCKTVSPHHRLDCSYRGTEYRSIEWCIEAAPIVRWMVGKPRYRLAVDCKRRGWSFERVPSG